MILIEKYKIKYGRFFEEECPEKFIDITEKGGLAAHLTENVLFAEDLTFRDFFNHLVRKKNALNKVFQSSLGRLKIDNFIEDINMPVIEKEEELSCVQVCWRAEANHEFIEIECCFDGVGKGTDGNRENGIETTYCISFTPLNTYADLPFRLNKQFIIEKYHTKPKSKIEKVLKIKREFTVFEVLHAVLYEITWHGTPEMRNKQAAELSESVKRIDIGKEKLYTMEEVIKTVENKIKSKKHL